MQTHDAGICPQRIRLEQPALVLIVIGIEGNATAPHVGRVFGNLRQDAEQGVWSGEVVLHLHDVALEGMFCIFDDTLCYDGLRRQLHFGILLQLIFH